MKKRKIAIGISAALLLGVIVLTGCSGADAPKLANEMTFELKGIRELKISYDEENITFFKTNKEELLVKEYMSKTKERYYADVTQSDQSIQISEGRRPLFDKEFSRYVEVYLPASYNAGLEITTTDGSIDISALELNLDSLRADSTAGDMRFGNITASDIHLSTTKGTIKLSTADAGRIKLLTTSGKIDCGELKGKVEYTSTSGSIHVKAAVGSGSYRADNSGGLQVTYSKVTGDLNFYNKNDDVNVILPGDLQFELQADSKNGAISTNFQRMLQANGSCIVGENPRITVKAESKNGNIKITRQ